MFKVTGISTLNGVTKVRFANDLVSRVKILNKDGHTDINLVELPSALSKADCVKYLKGSDLYVKFADAIKIVDEYILKSRRELCEACPFKMGKRCTICTCYIKQKTRLSTESCPKNKW